MIILDSNIIIAAVKIEEIHHQAACEILEREDQFLIFDFIIAEIYTVLLMRTSYEDALNTLNWILTDPRFTIEEGTNTEKQLTIEFIQKNKTKLSFIDVQLLIAHKNRNLSLRTFDKILSQH